jgi:tetraprenyl-beta-curcumene synthase
MSRSATLAASPRPAEAHPAAAVIAQLPGARPAIDGRLAAQACVALLVANARYWSTVAPLVRRQLRRWRRRARAIEDPMLSALALQKLSEEGFNAEVAATLATLAPRSHRRGVVEAIVALEILFDYLDGLTEAPTGESPDDGYRLFKAFTDAVTPAARPAGDYFRHHLGPDDGGYLEELAAAVRHALAGLPTTVKLTDIMRRCAERSAEAQLHIHAACVAETGQLERWGRACAIDTQMGWREYVAGAASSVLAVHALIAAAADHRTTHAQGLEIDRIYLPIAALPTILDSLIDYERDSVAGRPGYVRYYDGSGVLARQLADVIHEGLARARRVPHGAHHVMTLVGVVAYYASAPSARSDFARPVTEQVREHLRPIIGPTLAVMLAWRTAKRARTRWQGPRFIRADRSA